MRPEIRERFLAFQWELTRFADQLLFGESAPSASLAGLPAPADPAATAATFTDDQLVKFLSYLAQRVGNLEIDVRQVKQLQMALLQSPDASSSRSVKPPGLGDDDGDDDDVGDD
jgi:hypothetical protein